MSALDRFIEEAAVRLDLGYRARSVVGVLVGWIASHPLGLDGLEQQFEQAGLGARFRSWQRHAEPSQPIVASELERAIGAHALATLARRSVLPPGMFRVIACDLLPGLVNVMTPPGGHALAVAAATRRHPQLKRLSVRGAIPSRAMHGLALRSLLWTLVAVTLIGITTWLQLKMRAPLWMTAEVTEQRSAQLVLQQRGHHVEVQGRLPTEADRRRLWNALVALHGKANVHGDIALDHRVRTPRWLHRLPSRLAQLQGDGLMLAFDGDQLQVDTAAMDEPQRLAVSRLLRRDFADLHSSGLWGPGLAALAQLRPGAETPALLEALNRTRLKFHPGSADLTGDCNDTVHAVAVALQAATPGTRLQIDAHTDSRGDAAGNRQLSQQRAEAVVQALQAQGVPAQMLTAVGHGPDHPVADNRSEEGRARNRRIVYTLIEAG